MMPLNRPTTAICFFAATVSGCEQGAHDGWPIDGVAAEAGVGSDGSADDEEAGCDEACQNGGQLLWTWRSGGPSRDYVNSLIVGPDDSLYATFQIRFDPADDSSLGAPFALIANLDPQDGEAVWTRLMEEGPGNVLAVGGQGRYLASVGGPSDDAYLVDPATGDVSEPRDLQVQGRALPAIATGPAAHYVVSYDQGRRGLVHEVSTDLIGRDPLSPHPIVRTEILGPWEPVALATTTVEDRLFVAVVDDDGARGNILEVDADLAVVRQVPTAEPPHAIAAGGRGQVVVLAQSIDNPACDGMVARQYAADDLAVVEWEQCIAGSSANSVAIGSEGSVVALTEVGGRFSLTKFSGDGTLLWRRDTAVDDAPTTATELVINAQDHIFVAGSYRALPEAGKAWSTDTVVFVSRFSP